MDSYEQMNAIAKQCSYFAPVKNTSLHSSISLHDEINCTMCAHYDNGQCHIKDEILTSMDQT